MAGERVVVTGAQGFLGRHMAKHLADRGAEVTGIGLGEWETGWEKWGLSSWHCCEITIDNLKRFAGQPEKVFHCAGSGFVGYSISHPLEDFQSTACSIAHTLEFVRMQAPEARVAYPSSAAVYGQATRMPISEDTPLCPVSPYGVHKKFAEELCRSYSAHFGVKTALVRFFSLYGPGLQKQLLWDACEKSQRGECRFFGTGRETRDWLHVSDGVALLQAASGRASAECPVANGGSGVETTLEDALIDLFRLLGNGLKPSFDGRGTGVDPQRYLADIRRANAWGWSPTIGLKAGLEDYARWYLARRA